MHLALGRFLHHSYDCDINLQNRVIDVFIRIGYHVPLSLDHKSGLSLV